MHFNRLFLGALLAAACAAATARNDRLLLPIDAAMRSNGTRAMLAPDIALRFGAASNQAGDAGFVLAHAVADPFGGGNPATGGSRQRRADEVVCLDAFRKALVDLQQKARQQSGTAVVGIVSNYNNVVLDSREVYECHIGHSRGVVDLKGVVARNAMPVMAPPLAPAAPRAPLAAEAPAAPLAPPPPRFASGYAAIDDIDAVPYLSDRGREEYRRYLTWPTPKAFALASNGYFWSASGLKPKDPALPTDPTERALQGCERAAKMACKLYAVNGAVVWGK
ncbi:hypothetical protein LZ009_01410 [Ramlibacter sp. XY19]|uniref:hypothetical protein n=1 Tax=Ramlibacter paludis TaxID=2908000 RepID=UPI0023DC4789|nr:hypothetical protein [Ramlibacter paludis]MCG2591437.1 hypothetical protein [Ramlibacter paludis]